MARYEGDYEDPPLPLFDWTMSAETTTEKVILVARNGERFVKVELFRPVSRRELSDGLRFLSSKL